MRRFGAHYFRDWSDLVLEEIRRSFEACLLRIWRDEERMSMEDA